MEVSVLKGLWDEKLVTHSTLVWQSGSKIGWKKIKRLPVLLAYLNPKADAKAGASPPPATKALPPPPAPPPPGRQTSVSSSDSGRPVPTESPTQPEPQIVISAPATEEEGEIPAPPPPKPEPKLDPKPEPKPEPQPEPKPDPKPKAIAASPLNATSAPPQGGPLVPPPPQRRNPVWQDLDIDSDKNWYFVSSDKGANGPISLRLMKGAFNDEKRGLNGDTLIWHAVKHSGQSWFKAKDIDKVWAYITSPQDAPKPLQPSLNESPPNPSAGTRHRKRRFTLDGASSATALARSSARSAASAQIPAEKHRWFYVDSTRRRCGPVTPEQLSRLWVSSNSSLDVHTMVWNMDSAQFKTWTRVQDVAEIFSNIFPSERKREYPGEKIWHYVEGKQSVGPVTAARLRDQFWNGALLPSTLVWKSRGMKEWAKLSVCDEYESYFKKPKPLPPIPS